MNKKIFLLIALAFVMALTGCNKSSAFENMLEQGYNIKVVFDGNGGLFDEETQRYTYVKENSYICEPGENASTISAVSRQGYTCIGWFVAENTDDDGNPLKDEEGNAILSNKAWDFNSDIVTQNITLCAKWEVNYRFSLRYVYEDPVTKVLTLDEENVKNEVIKNSYQIKEIFGNEEQMTLKNTTYIGLYKDQECTEEISTNYTHQLNPNSPDETVYVKCYLGKYTLATSASDFERMTSTSNFILQNDIDFTDVEMRALASYSGTIIGNGYAMKNLSINYTDTHIAYTSFGLFGKLDGANLLDVNFENCNVNVTLTASSRNPLIKELGFFAGSVKNSTIRNVILKNCGIQLLVSPDAQNVYVEADAENNYYYKNSSDSTFEEISGNISYQEGVPSEENS